MKKLILAVILGLCLFSLTSEVNGGACQGKGSRKLNLFNTNITNERLAELLEKKGETLKRLYLGWCSNLTDFSPIVNCPNLEALSLNKTNINSEQLSAIWDELGGNLRLLSLADCKELDDFSFLSQTYCDNLQTLDLSGTSITESQCDFSEIKGNLREVDLRWCANLQSKREKIIDEMQEYDAARSFQIKI